MFIKSRRHWSYCVSVNFSEILLLDGDTFDKYFKTKKDLFDMYHSEAVDIEKKLNLFSDKDIFNKITLPSSKTSKDLLRKGKLTLNNIWETFTS